MLGLPLSGGPWGAMAPRGPWGWLQGPRRVLHAVVGVGAAVGLASSPHNAAVLQAAALGQQPPAY